MPQAQLRHFAHDPDRRSIWFFDKRDGSARTTAILNAGSENDFNTVELDGGKWNFEDLFRDVDARSARLVFEIVARRSVGWLGREDRDALKDLFATQMVRTHFARTTPRHLAGRMREIVQGMGYDVDSDPSMAMPTEASLRLGAVRAFLGRDRIAQSMERLIPVLFAAGDGQGFVLSDDPIAITNAFSYGEAALAAHGAIALLPVAPDLAVALTCPTIIMRYESIDRVEMAHVQRARMERYREGFRSGTAIQIQAAEVDGWNRHQVVRSARFLYASKDDFDFARRILQGNPQLRRVHTHAEIGEMGRAHHRLAGLPPGLQLVVQGRYDHCMLPIVEYRETAEGLTLRTTNVELMELVARDEGDIRATLYEDGQPRRGMSAATVERFGEPAEGWFHVVHRDKSLQALMRQIALD